MERTSDRRKPAVLVEIGSPPLAGGDASPNWGILFGAGVKAGRFPQESADPGGNLAMGFLPPPRRCAIIQFWAVGTEDLLPDDFAPSSRLLFARRRRGRVVED